jgi:D-3-phosphoglycerate dehydrogenase
MRATAHVLITSRSFMTASVDQRLVLERAGAVVTFGHSDHSLTALAPVLSTVTHWVAGAAPVTAAHLELAPGLRLVARYGTGYDAVDLDAARAHDLWVTHTPGTNAAAVAEFALALCLDGWAAAETPRNDLSSLTAGLWGLGRVGSALATRLRALGCEVLAHDPFAPKPTFEAVGAREANPDELAAGCGLVSLHRPGGEVVVDQHWLRKVSGGLVLVNTARSSLVEPRALAWALLDGRVAAYRSDVDDLGPASPLSEPAVRGRVRLTDHRAAHSQQAVDTTATRVVAQVLAVMNQAVPPDVLVCPTEGVT